MVYVHLVEGVICIDIREISYDGYAWLRFITKWMLDLRMVLVLFYSLGVGFILIDL